MCRLVGFTNLITCILFYYMFISLRRSLNKGDFQYIMAVPILVHVGLNSILINWSLNYENPPWIKWAWSSLIFLLPVGVILIFLSTSEKMWQGAKPLAEGKNKAFHSFTNSFINVNGILSSAINYLQTNHGTEFKKLMDSAELNTEEHEQWPNKVKYVIIAMAEALKQTKKKSTLEDIVFGARWYDRRHFDFAIVDPKSKVVPNMRYKYSFGFVVLDEFNNYQKILDGKKEIRQNLRFGPAKAICLHWGKDFKIFVNE